MSQVASPAIAISGLTKSYGRVTALQDVSFTVQSGAVTALLGLNGAGKTTLFQILTGLFVADTGQVVVRGHDIARSPTAALARMGIVFQQTVLDLDLTVAQNMAFYAGLHGLRGAAAAAAARDALGTVGCIDLGPRVVRQLSGGTRRKIEIARALLTRPDVLLLDEPSGGLDAGSRSELVKTVFGLAAERDTAVLWATHLVQEVEPARTVVILHRGRVAAVGSPRSLIAQAGTTSLEAAFLALTGAITDTPA